jgi:hypothetical protein
MGSDLLFDGKTYISSKRAASISGYVNDYIGQLCRSGAIEAKMVGRTWYVSLESLIAHKNENASGTKSKPVWVYKNTSLIPPLAEYRLRAAAPITLPMIAPELLLLPAPAFATGVADAHIVPVRVAAPVVEIVAENAPSADVAAPVIAVVAPSASVKAVPSPFVPVVSGVRSIIAIVLVFLAGAFILGSRMDSRVVAAGNDASAITAMRSVIDKTALSFYRTVEGALSSTRNTILVLTGSAPVPREDKDVVTTASPREGLVVVPRDGRDVGATVEKVRASFSDQVEVSVNDSGSGVITPVFRQGAGEEYIYVLVPIGN